MSGLPEERLYTTAFSGAPRVGTRNAMPDGVPGRVITGYAAVFGKRSHPMGGVTEFVEPSFFNKSQGDGWPMLVARHEHDKLMLLGTHAAGTLAVKIDQHGLNYSVRLPEHRGDVWELAERGDLPGSSFSFQAYEDDWRLGDGGIPERHLVSGRTIDVATTAVPAYPDSSLKVAYRSLAAFVDADPDEVARDAQNGQLARYLSDRHPAYIDMASSPAPAEARNHSAGQQVTPNDLQRRLDENRARALDANRDERQELARRLEANRRRGERYDLEDRVAQHHRKMSGPLAAEQRNLDAYQEARIAALLRVE